MVTRYANIKKFRTPNILELTREKIESIIENNKKCRAKITETVDRNGKKIIVRYYKSIGFRVYVEEC